MRSRYIALALGVLLLGLIGFMSPLSFAQNPATQASQPTAVLFENVRIFDGTAEQLSAPSNVLVVGNQIETIDTRPFPIPAGSDLTRINGEGRVLMPGLIDAHTHLFMETSTQEELEAGAGSPELLFRKAEENATAMLLRGFTSVRDVAGPVFELKRSIDRGDVVGPRIWPSGAMISQTSGHGDFREVEELPRTPMSPLSPAEEIGVSAIADGVPEVLRRSREQLMRGPARLSWRRGAGWPQPTTRSTSANTPKPSLKRRWMRRKTGTLMWPSMPIPTKPFRQRCGQELKALSTVS